MKSAVDFAGTALLTLVAAAYGGVQTSAQVQTGCSTGIVTLPAGINGDAKICPLVAAQAPDLGRQLSHIHSAMSSQQAQSAQLTRLVNDMNQVGGPPGARRQAELLTNVLERLGDPSTVSGAQLQQRATTLSGHFEDVSTQITAAQADPTEAAKTKAALEGSMGDAIARLDFDTVTNQLSDIQATVHAVDQRTQQIQGTVNDIHSDTHETAQILEQAMAQSTQQAQEMQQQMLNSPQYFVRITFFRVSGKIGGPGTIEFRVMHSAEGTLTDAKMQFAFSMAGQQPWTFNAEVPQVEDRSNFSSAMDTLDATKLGDHVVVCYSAMDSRVSQRRRWRATYQIVSQPSPFAGKYSSAQLAQMERSSPQMAALLNPLAFQPDSVATLTPDSDAPCQ